MFRHSPLRFSPQALERLQQRRDANPIVDLPLPFPPPAGAEWIEVYRHWLGHQ